MYHPLNTSRTAMKTILPAVVLMSCAMALAAPPTSPPDEYFKTQTDQIASSSLSEIKTTDDWNAHKEQYRQQLADMLGLWPMPEKTDLHPTITGRIDHDDFVVENLHFQSMPHLYVTA